MFGIEDKKANESPAYINKLRNVSINLIDLSKNLLINIVDLSKDIANWGFDCPIFPASHKLFSFLYRELYKHPKNWLAVLSAEKICSKAAVTYAKAAEEETSWFKSLSYSFKSKKLLVKSSLARLIRTKGVYKQFK